MRMWTSCLLLVGGSLTAAAIEPVELGPDDRVTIGVTGVPELSEGAYRIAPSGEIRLPWVGEVKAAGLEPAELELAIGQLLAVYVRDPRVVVSVEELASRPVSVLGAVNQPGVIALSGERTLAEALSSAGGLRPNAGGSLTLTRRAEQGAPPIRGAVLDAGGMFYVAKVNMRSLLNGTDPGQNILVRPHDVITAPPADRVYVIGSVKQPGGFEMGDQGVSLLQALALAGGLAPHSQPRRARLLRGDDPGGRIEKEIDVKAMIDGKAPDESLEGNDVVFIPQSGSKTAASHLVRSVMTIGVGAAIWTFARND
jgi:polysaccharide export outer membrane protein